MLLLLSSIYQSDLKGVVRHFHSRYRGQNEYIQPRSECIKENSSYAYLLIHCRFVEVVGNDNNLLNLDDS